MLRIDVLTLFPAMFQGLLGESIVKIAREKGLVEVVLHDIREHAGNKHGKVDDRPYGGGPGMLMAPGPVFRCVEAVLGREVGPGTPPVGGPASAGSSPDGVPRSVRPILLTPQGRRLDQGVLEGLAQAARILLVCGRYEGFDERIREGLGFEELSIGDYVLSGGEPAAMVVIDGVVRLLPGALGDSESAGQESFSRRSGQTLLEGPQYTRPPVFRGMAVPEVLLSGHHGEIEKWRHERALERTKATRPDLLDRRADA